MTSSARFPSLRRSAPCIRRTPNGTACAGSSPASWSVSGGTKPPVAMSDRPRVFGWCLDMLHAACRRQYTDWNHKLVSCECDCHKEDA